MMDDHSNAKILQDQDKATGYASTEANVKGFYVYIQMSDPRPEYEDKAKRAGQRLHDAFSADPDLWRAFSYLASDTPFAVVVAPKEQRRIITP